jgi:ABC-type phosphate/phosphonate transport system ATPase subunit
MNKQERRLFNEAKFRLGEISEAPFIVSIIGQTEVGKSSLMKLLMVIANKMSGEASIRINNFLSDKK